MDDNVTLMQRIAALHVVYQLNKPQVLWFGQLVTHSPGIMVHLRTKSNFSDKTEMVCTWTMGRLSILTMHMVKPVYSNRLRAIKSGGLTVMQIISYHMRYMCQYPAACLPAGSVVGIMPFTIAPLYYT